MRRFLTWTLPLAAGIGLAALFAWGFALGLGGETGELVRDGETVRDERPDAATAPGEQLVVVLGDSLARGTGDEIGEGIGGRLSTILEERGVEHETANLAVNGARTEDLLELIERDNVRRLLADASIVLVSIGGNDFFGQQDDFRPGEWAPPQPGEVLEPIRGRIETIVQEIRELNGNTRIFVLGLYNPFRDGPGGEVFEPLVAQWNAELLETLAGDGRVVVVQTSDLFIDNDRLSADRFHPNGEAYGLIARRIADSLPLGTSRTVER